MWSEKTVYLRLAKRYMAFARNLRRQRSSDKPITHKVLAMSISPQRPALIIGRQYSMPFYSTHIYELGIYWPFIYLLDIDPSLVYTSPLRWLIRETVVRFDRRQAVSVSVSLTRYRSHIMRVMIVYVSRSYFRIPMLHGRIHLRGDSIRHRTKINPKHT